MWCKCSYTAVWINENQINSPEITVMAIQHITANTMTVSSKTGEYLGRNKKNSRFRCVTSRLWVQRLWWINILWEMNTGKVRFVTIFTNASQDAGIPWHLINITVSSWEQDTQSTDMKKEWYGKSAFGKPLLENR